MDGTLAAIYVGLALLDMGLNDCGGGCLAPSETPARAWIQGGVVDFQEDRIGEEIYVGYDFGAARGPFQPTAGLSVTDAGATWAGIGVKTQWRIGGGWFAEGSLMPGLYKAGDGPDLGGALQFRSALGLGYDFGRGGSLSVHYDHRSNADIESTNPGLETIAVRYSVTFD